MVHLSCPDRDYLRGGRDQPGSCSRRGERQASGGALVRFLSRRRRRAKVGNNGSTAVFCDRTTAKSRCWRARAILAAPTSQDAGHGPQPRCISGSCCLHCKPAPMTCLRRYSTRIGVAATGLLICSHLAVADERAERGRLLLTQNCADCHALGRTGESPLPSAPPFRRIGERMDLNELMARMREGLSSGHRDMPMFRFSREDARAIRSYLNSIRE